MGIVRTVYWNIGVIAFVIGLFTTFLSGDNFRFYGIILLLSGAAMIVFEFCGSVRRVQEFLEEGDDYQRFLEEREEEDERFLEDEQRKLDEEEKYLAELERKKKERHTETSENLGTIDLGMAGYFGGLVSIPDPEGVEIYLHDDRIEISFMKSNSTLEIPYRNITSVENMTKAEYSFLRDIYFPLPDLVTYTKIQYQENLEDRYVVIDFDTSLGFVMDFLDKKLEKK